MDFDRINAGETRLSIGAVNIETGNFVYFDNAPANGGRKWIIGPEHVMASGALPPGLPPVVIDGEAYWDGGIVSNTPLQFVLDEEHDDDLLIFQVDLFSSRGRMPQTLMEVSEREKDIRFSSRTRLNTDANLRINELKAALRRLIPALPADIRDQPDVKLIGEFVDDGAVTIVQLVYRSKPYEGASRDYEFSRQTMVEHWMSGLSDVRRSMTQRDDFERKPAQGDTAVFDPGWCSTTEPKGNLP